MYRMKHTPALRRLSRIALPVALSFLTGCAALEAQKIAGEGNRLVEKNQLDEAVSKFNASLAKGDNDTAHAGLAEAYLRQGKYSEAEQQARTAIKITNGQVVRYKLILARALLLQNEGPKAYETASEAVKQVKDQMTDPLSKATAKEGILLQGRIIQATGNPENSLGLLQDPNVQARWPDDLDFRAEVAVTMAMMGQHDQAMKLADSVIKMKSTEGDALLAKGMVLASKGEVAEAKKLLEKPLRDDHSRVMTFLSVTRQLRQEKKNPQAVELLEMLSQIMPKYHVLHGELAFVYLDLDKVPESIREHELALETSPSLKPYASKATLAEYEQALKDTPPAEYDRKNLGGFYENLAFLYGKQNNEEKSLLALERATAASPSLARYRNLAATYDRKGNTEAAIGALEKALVLEPKNAEVLTSLGTLAVKVNKPEKAREYFKQAAATGTGNADVHLNLGVVLYNSKQYGEALTEFEQAVQLNPDSVDSQFYLGLAQIKAGKKKEADATLKKVVALKPDYADAYRELGDLAMERKAYKDAEKYYNLEEKYKGKAPGKKK